MFFDPRYLIMMAPALLLAAIASFYTKQTFQKYARVRAASGVTGAQAAAMLLENAGIGHVRIERTSGFLGDHYDPLSHTLRLSSGVYDSPSLSAIGVACHEAGHAIQHAGRYLPLYLRSALVPATQLGSHGSYIIFFLGLIFNNPALLMLGVALFSLVVIFSVITLPVEWNASARAKRLMVSAGIVTPAEQPRAAAVLNAAFLTYVAAVISAIMTLLYYLMRARR
ncbi:MAG: zinc metallopeptidase [Kiritimatiellia bacterium]|nr:zinc metallopeptidase [Lentisphaerota bacterium]